MPEITETELKKQMEKSEFQRVYFLFGPEKYPMRIAAEKLAEKAYGGNFPDFNFQKFDGGETEIDTIANAVQALPMLSERKCVSVSALDAGNLRSVEAEKLWQLLSDIPETTVIIFSFPTFDFDIKKEKNWKKFYAMVVKTGAAVEFKRRTPAQLEKLLAAAAAKRGCSLQGRTASRIVGLCGTDMDTLFNELEKLCAFAAGGEITPQMADLLTTKNLETRVFDLSKAILAGNYDRAFQVLNQLFEQNEEPVAILSVLSGAFLDLYRVRAAVQSGMDALEPAKHFDYARKEFRLMNAQRDGKRLSMRMLRESLRALLAADTALKSARGNRSLILEKLIAELLCISEEGKIA